MKSGYLYNNEAIATIALGQFIKVHQAVDIAKIFLILPFLLHNSSIKALRNHTLKRSLEEYITKNTSSVIGFNDRYINFLPLTVNAITILQESNIIYIKKDIIFYNNKSTFNPTASTKIGGRTRYILTVIEDLSDLIKTEKSSLLYLKLKIKL